MFRPVMFDLPSSSEGRIVHRAWAFVLYLLHASITKQLGFFVCVLRKRKTSIFFRVINVVCFVKQAEIATVVAFFVYIWSTGSNIFALQNRLRRESSVIRAFSGCLGTGRRWRTWYAAKSVGELRISFDPAISEWGNPTLIWYLNCILQSQWRKSTDPT